MATQQHRLAPPPPGGSRDWMWAGMASSAMGVTAGMAGPPVALQALRSGRPVTESRATLAAFLLVIDLAAVLTRGPMALDRSTLVLVAGGLAGYSAGGIARRNVPDQAVPPAAPVLGAGRSEIGRDRKER